MEKTFYPEIPIRCIVSGKSISGKSTLLSKILFNIINEFDKIYTYSPTIHQQSCQKMIKCFQSFLPLNVIDNILQADIDIEDLDDIIEEIVKDEDFVSSEIEYEAYDNIDEMKDEQQYDGDKHNITILDDLSKDQLNDKKVQMLFKRGRDNNISVFVISRGFYELLKDTIRENSNIIHHFVTNNYTNVECIHRQLYRTDMKIQEF